MRVKTTGEPQAPTGKEVQLRSIFDTRLVIRNAPSRRVYDFQPGEEKPVLVEDKIYLLALVRKPDGCCGGTIQGRRYFEEV